MSLWTDALLLFFGKNPPQLPDKILSDIFFKKHHHLFRLFLEGLQPIPQPQYNLDTGTVDPEFPRKPKYHGEFFDIINGIESGSLCPLRTDQAFPLIEPESLRMHIQHSCHNAYHENRLFFVPGFHHVCNNLSRGVS